MKFDDFRLLELNEQYYTYTWGENLLWQSIDFADYFLTEKDYKFQSIARKYYEI